jgi:hypothetical protein
MSAAWPTRPRENVYDEPETRRLLGLDQPEERDPDLDFLLAERYERACDAIDAVSAGWRDARGFPLEGFEPTRHYSAREREHIRWYMSSDPDAVRTRHAYGESR